LSSDAAPVSRFVRRLLSRSALDVNEQQALLRLSGQVAQMRPNQEFVTAGETVDHSCLVADGLAARHDQVGDGARRYTAFYVPGDMCDLDSMACPTTVSGLLALTATTILRVPHVELRRLVDGYPGIALAFSRDKAAEASIRAEWTRNLTRKPARARMAHLICEMGVRMELAALGARHSFRLDVAQQHLAEALGITSVHVSRTLQSLRSTGLLRTKSQRIFIEDWSGLASLGRFDSSYLLVDGPDRAFSQNKLRQRVVRRL